MKKDQIILLIKYIDPKYLWSFLEGDVHFASLNYFRKEEIENLDKVLGDGAEGTIFNYGDVTEVVKLGQNLPSWSGEQAQILMDKVPYKQRIPFEIGISPEDRSRIGIASFFAIRYDDVIKDNVIKDLDDFNKGYNRIPVVIPFQDILLGRFEEQQIDFDKIKYYDSHKYQSEIIDKVIKKPVIAVFYKRKEYAAQREFRLVTPVNDIEKGETVNISLITRLIRVYGSGILPQLVFSWKEKPEVTTRLSQCEKMLLFGKTR